MKQSWQPSLYLFSVLFIFTSFIGTLASAGFLHPDHEGRIMDATHLIEEHPESAQLYFNRGELHLQHDDYDAALADFERVLQIDPSMSGAQVARALALQKGGWHRAARVVLNVYLKQHPKDQKALLTRARALAAIGEHLMAAQDFSAALKIASDLKPDFFIEMAGEYALAGDAYFNDALLAVDLGVERFGPLITLELVAIDLELKLGKVDRALDRLGLVMEQSQRKERYLIRRGEILENADRFDEAKTAYESGLVAIRMLPHRHRVTKSTAALESEARKALARVNQQMESGTP